MPSSLNPPVRVSTTETVISLTWREPELLNSCPLKGFNLLRDDGAGGSISTVVDTNLNDNPTIHDYDVTLLPADTSKKFRFILEAIF